MPTTTRTRIHYTYTSLTGKEKKTYFSTTFPVTITTEEAMRMVKEHGIGMNPVFKKITIK